MYACLAVTCHLRFWQNDRGLLRATAVTRGWNGYRNRVSTENWPWRRKFSRRSNGDSNPRPFDHESGALTTELSLLPEVCFYLHCVINHVEQQQKSVLTIQFSWKWFKIKKRIQLQGENNVKAKMVLINMFVYWWLFGCSCWLFLVASSTHVSVWVGGWRGGGGVVSVHWLTYELYFS